MKRRDFIKLSAAISICPLELLANSAHTIYSAPALASIMIARAALEFSNVNVAIWKNPDELRAGVASKKFALMMSPVNVCSMLFNKGFSVGYLNFLTHSINSIMSKNAPASELKDLANLRLIMPFKNDMPDIVLQTLLKHHGITPASINYTSTPAEALALFLSKDEFDAAYLPEPIASAAVLKAKMKSLEIYRGFNTKKLWQASFKSDIYQAGMIVNREYFINHASFFEDFSKHLKNALTWVQKNPNEAGILGESLLNAPAPAISNAIEHANLCVVDASSAKADVLSFLEVLASYNPALIGGKLPSEKIFLR